LKNYHSYSEIRSDLDLGIVSCEDIVNHHLAVIQAKNPLINAFLEVFSVEALLQAKAIDKKIKNGSAGRLAGLVVGIKDLFCFSGHQLTCASKILEGFESQITATCIERLLTEDAIVIGRQNCDEFAMGSSNENSAYGITRNPIDESTVPGGSSGASAAAVAADMCQVSIGSDTGGSVRQPASFCGIVGLKPTYSRISRYGLTAYASSFDCVGVLSKSVEDAQLVLDVMAGHDPRDSTSSKKPALPSHEEQRANKKIVFFKELSSASGCTQEIKESFSNFRQQLTEQGHEVVEMSFPYLDYLLPIYYILTSAEASANLSRYDGVRYGKRVGGAEVLEQMYKRTRTEGFGEEVLRRIILGTFVLSSSYQDAFYTKAQKARRLVKDFTANILENHDFIVMPTTPTTAFKIGEKSEDPLEMYLSDIFTVQASVSGLPAISIPYGADKSGLPIGMQIISGAFEEHKLLHFADRLMITQTV
jgi:aspartyl-tRNA(Asn)/glutamyl-tRNA(Gln) amidotransferase subunit A